MFCHFNLHNSSLVLLLLKHYKEKIKRSEVKLLLPLLFNIVMDKIVVTVEKDRNSSQSKNLLQHVKVIIP